MTFDAIRGGALGRELAGGGGLDALSKDAFGDTARRAGGGAEAPTGVSFGDLLGRLVENADQAQRTSDDMVQALAKGEPADAHQVMMAMTEADLAFRTLLEVRNRIIDAYQEIQRMQV